MKYLSTITFFLVLFSCTPTLAQQWCSPGAEWYYTAAPSGSCLGYVHMTLGTDSIVAGHACARIERVRSAGCVDSFHLQDTLTDLFSYAEGGVVWMYDPHMEAFDTLYNMNAGPGDSWQFIALPEPGSPDPPDISIVADTGTFFVDNTALHWLAIDSYVPSYSEQPYRDTVVERIGTLKTYMLPYDYPNGFVDGQEAGDLRCYHDAEISLDRLLPGISPTCDFQVGIPEHQQATLLHLVTGPDGATRITWSGHKTFMLCIRDVLGRMRRQPQVASEGFLLDTQDLPFGCYFVDVSSGTERTAVKWIRQ